MGDSKGSFLREMGLALSWRWNEAIAMVWVYYDESGEYDSGGTLLNMSVAGCVAPLVSARSDPCSGDCRDW